MAWTPGAAMAAAIFCLGPGGNPHHHRRHLEFDFYDGGQAIAFELIAAGRVVKCTVSRESLQHYFGFNLMRTRPVCSRPSMTAAAEK